MTTLLRNLFPEDNFDILAQILWEAGEKAFGKNLFAQIAKPPVPGRAGLPVIPLKGNKPVRLAFGTVLMREIARELINNQLVLRLERVTEEGAVEVQYLGPTVTARELLMFIAGK